MYTGEMINIMKESDLLIKIDELMEFVPEARHSYFQLKYFVIGKEVTHQAKLWQCLKELAVRKEVIDSAMLQIEEMKDRIELLEIRKIKKGKNTSLDNREWVIRCRQIERKKTALHLSIKKLEENKTFALQEARFFVQAFEALNNIEPLKDYDDFESQQEYHSAHLAQQINLKMLLKEPLNTELVKTALAMPEESSLRQQIEGVVKQLTLQIPKNLKEDDGSTTQNHECR